MAGSWKGLLALPSCLALALTGWIMPAAADGWREAIDTVRASQAAYEDYAVRVGGTSWAGTMYNGWMSQEHQCAILGRMLGMPETIRHLEEFDYPPMDATSDPNDLLVFSISLDNWVAAAEWALAAEEHQRINAWNLDCAGHFGIPPDTMLASDRPEAEFVAEGSRLLVYGDIDRDFAARFAAALRAHPEVTKVLLGSGGGSVADALEAGLMIRRLGLDTTLYGNCYSAYPLVFLGGVDRVLWAAPHRLGFHQVYTGQGRALPFDAPVYGLIRQYAGAMGANPDIVLGWMWSAGPSDMLEPDPRDLCGTGVTTFVQRIC